MDSNLWHSRGEYFTLTTHRDVDWEGNIDDRKIASGGAFFLGNILVPWLSKKQPSVSLSIEDVKYIAGTSCWTQFFLMKQALRDIKVEYDHPISLLCNNTSAINISKNLVMH